MLLYISLIFCSVCVIICINSVACDEYCLDCLCVVHAFQYLSYVYVTTLVISKWAFLIMLPLKVI